MDIYEELVMHYLCDGKPWRFLVPNFRLAGGWAFPDFVLLDFRKKCVSVVEVTTAANPEKLIEKVRNRDTQWFGKLKEQLGRDKIAERWEYDVQVFVRDTVAQSFGERFAGQNDVIIRQLDDTILHSWKWDWKERE